ncbi:MAG: tetratricopeptide repeat protein [Xanthobacteraceae bacterium]|nr:tetratricopeptide repeat protein [Xanthobacteraceae bacterium]
MRTHRRENYDRALTDYNAAIAADPKEVNAFYNRGVAYERKKDFVKARADYERAIAMPTETAKHRSAQQLAREALKTIAGR